ncbi:MAG: amidohydrolase family protein [Pseudomonadales bacterium]
MSQTNTSRTELDDQRWLAQVEEEVLDPEQIICDAHHHLWDYAENQYLLPDLLADIGDGHKVVSTVFMECNSMYRKAGPVAMAPVGETEFVQGIAAMSASGNYGPAQVAAGIVGFADLGLGEAVRLVLDAHVQASPNRFRGIRHATSWHADPGIRNAHTNPSESLSRTEAFREGYSVLGDMALSFDAWCYFEQIPELVELARDFPETTMIVDHFAGPLGIGAYRNKDEVFATWQKLMQPFESLDNVYFKLGGINMKVNGFDWHKQQLPPTSDDLVAATGHYYRHCIDHFGAERCLFESNFPVDKVSCSYRVLFNAFKKIASAYSPGERNQLFHDTAARVYRL